MCMCVPFCNFVDFIFMLFKTKLILHSFGIVMKKWTSHCVDLMMVVSFWMFVSVISKLIKPYHCCVYGSFCHICSCINANKDVWLVLSGMMAISSGKKCSQFCCAVVVQEQRLILCLSCFIVLNGGLFSCCGLCSKKLHSQWWPISLSERKD